MKKSLIVIALAICAIHFVMATRARWALQKVFDARKPTTLQNFVDYFPDRDADALEVLYCRLQDMLKVAHGAFPIEPTDEIYKTYRIHRSELTEVLDQIASECGIRRDALSSFLERNKRPTVRDVAMLVAIA